MIGRKIYYFLNSAQRHMLRRIIWLPYDFYIRLTGRKNKLVPDKGLNFTGRGDYTAEGMRFLDYFMKFGGLQPHYKVLEVGSGIGRMAVPLLGFLNREGSYRGFDIVENGVEWCRKNISALNPSFQFSYYDIHNDLYNSDGKKSSTDFIFPFGNNEFDFIIATSVFTHMIKEEVVHYLEQLSRVMKKGATGLITWYFLNAESEDLISRGYSRFTFPYAFVQYRIMNKSTQTANVAYEEKFIRTTLHDFNFRITEYLPGSWCGREKKASLDFQDILVIEKT
jgi:cyclopropane fatty-acyl-phospholipid synthase-like methyltransferase